MCSGIIPDPISYSTLYKYPYAPSQSGKKMDPYPCPPGTRRVSGIRWICCCKNFLTSRGLVDLLVVGSCRRGCWSTGAAADAGRRPSRTSAAEKHATSADRKQTRGRAGDLLLPAGERRRPAAVCWGTAVSGCCLLVRPTVHSRCLSQV